MTVIAMTQEMATLGRDVSAGVAEALGLKLVRHEIGDEVAERMKLEKSLVRRMREGKAGWFEKRAVDVSTFALYSAEEVFDLALEGNALIRGWGATCLLYPVKHVPCIRVCAPFENRMKWLMERLQTDDRDLAREELERSDSAHAARIRKNFGMDLGDSTRYDLSLNTGRVPIESCVEQIIALSRRPEFQPTEASIAHLRNLALSARIHTAFRSSPEGANIHVNVVSDDGAVTLSGIVVTEQEKKTAAKLARGVTGVESVDNRLRTMKGATKRFPSAKNI